MVSLKSILSNTLVSRAKTLDNPPVAITLLTFFLFIFWNYTIYQAQIASINPWLHTINCILPNYIGGLFTSMWGKAAAASCKAFVDKETPGAITPPI